MENHSALWNLILFAAALVALVVIAALVARVRRTRAARDPGRSAEAASPEAAEEDLDSSHIGFAPLVRSSLPPRDEGAGKARR